MRGGGRGVGGEVNEGGGGLGSAGECGSEEEGLEVVEVFPWEVVEAEESEGSEGGGAGGAEVWKYKKVANRTLPVATTLPEEFRIMRIAPPDPLVLIPVLPTDPPDFTPGERYTRERYEALNIDPAGFMWKDEKKLAHYVMKVVSGSPPKVKIIHDLRTQGFLAFGNQGDKV